MFPPPDCESGSPLYRQLWAPWRMAYVAESPEERPQGCFLCHGRDSDDDRANLVVWRDEQTLIVLNRYPYNNGHLLVAPRAHKATLEELDDGELLACMQQVQRMTRLLSQLIKPDGFNIGLNLGTAAGAGLPGHLHWHVVPRWFGDTNFMPVLADLKVIPQSLEALYQLLTEAMSESADD